MIYPKNHILARTWNRNETGILWECLWGQDTDGYFSKTINHNTFVPPARYLSEHAFWEAFEVEKKHFAGTKEEDNI